MEGIFLIGGIFLVGLILFEIGKKINKRNALKTKNPYELLDEARACFYWNGIGDQDGIDCLKKAFKYSENKKDPGLFGDLAIEFLNLDFEGADELMKECYRRQEELLPRGDELYYENGKLKRRRKRKDRS